MIPSNIALIFRSQITSLAWTLLNLNIKLKLNSSVLGSQAVTQTQLSEKLKFQSG